MKLVPWVVSGRIVDGELVRSIDFDRYEEKLGFRPTGNPQFRGRWLLLTDEGELVNVNTEHLHQDWGSGRLIKEDAIGNELQVVSNN